MALSTTLNSQNIRHHGYKKKNLQIMKFLYLILESESGLQCVCALNKIGAKFFEHTNSNTVIHWVNR